MYVPNSVIISSVSCHHPGIRYRFKLAKILVCAFKKMEELLRFLDTDRVKEVTFSNYEGLESSKKILTLVTENRTRS